MHVFAETNSDRQHRHGLQKVSFSSRHHQACQSLVPVQVYQTHGCKSQRASPERIERIAVGITPQGEQRQGHEQNASKSKPAENRPDD